MGRHLILTVHGIGEQKPGEMIDEIVGAATTPYVRKPTDPDSKPESFEPVDVHRDRIELPETSFDGAPRNAKFFPVHLRRVRKVNHTCNQDDAVFAEVFWADKSSAPSGFFWTAFELLRVILGLGYIAMDNVENTRGKFTGALVHGFTWVIFAGIAPANAVLLLGVGLLMLDLTTFRLQVDQILMLFAAHGLISATIGFWLSRDFWLSKKVPSLVKPLTYLVRLFGFGMITFGVLILAATVAQNIWPDWYCPCDPFNDGEPIKYLAAQEIEILNRFSGSVPAMLSVLSVLWTFAVFLALIIYLASFAGQFLDRLLIWVEQKCNRRQYSLTEDQSFLNSKVGKLCRYLKNPSDPVSFWDNREIYPSICAAMILFWLTFTAAFWYFLLDLITRFSAAVTPSTLLPARFFHGHDNVSVPQVILDDQLRVGLQSLPVAATGVAAMLGVAIFLFVYRKWNAQELYKEPAILSRMILNFLLRCAFFLALYLTAYAVHGMAEVVISEPGFLDGFLKFMVPPIHFLFENVLAVVFFLPLDGVVCKINDFREFLPIIFLALATGIYYFSDHIAGALGIVRDIVSYAQVNHCSLFKDVTERDDEFQLRGEINDRFRSVIKYALETVNPIAITIICHSQGTVIATQMLQDGIVRGLLKPYLDENEKNVIPIKLVTMGSPVTHVYQHYFPKDFGLKFEEPGACKDSPNLLPRNLKWYNIFRSDDFVGTRVTEDLVEENLDVNPGGHTGYFTDYEVWGHLWGEKVKFSLFVQSPKV